MSDICRSLNLDLQSLHGACITLEEREHMDATFMILSVIQLFTKESAEEPTNRQVVLVLFQNTFLHLNNLATKLFLNLKLLVKNKKIILLELFNEISVQEKFKSIHKCMNEVKGKGTLLVLSNLNSITYMGCPSQDIANFLHYIKSTFKSNTCLLHCTHNKQDEVVTKLNNMCKHVSSYVIEVSNLKTGFCKEISGHIVVSNKFDMYKKTHHFQFTNRGVNVFLPGGLSTR